MSVRYRINTLFMILIGVSLIVQTLSGWVVPMVYSKSQEQPVAAPAITGTPNADGAQSRMITATPSNTATPSISPTQCPQATQEPLWVEPVVSPTNLLTQTITIYAGRAMTITVSSEAGVITHTVGPSWLSSMTINLLPNTTHHLLVKTYIPISTGWGGCTYGGYSLETTRDKQGSPLTIVQSGGATVTPTLSPLPTATSAVSQGLWQTYLPALLK